MAEQDRIQTLHDNLDHILWDSQIIYSKLFTLSHSQDYF